MQAEVEGRDYHWGPDPGHGGLTKHKGGSRVDCPGPDCGYSGENTYSIERGEKSYFEVGPVPGRKSIALVVSENAPRREVLAYFRNEQSAMRFLELMVRLANMGIHDE